VEGFKKTRPQGKKKAAQISPKRIEVWGAVDQNKPGVVYIRTAKSEKKTID